MIKSLQDVLGSFPNILDLKGLFFNAGGLFVQKVKQNLVPQDRVNTLLVCPVETIGTDSLLLFQSIREPPELPIESGKLI